MNTPHTIPPHLKPLYEARMRLRLLHLKKSYAAKAAKTFSAVKRIKPGPTPTAVAKRPPKTR